jgi:apolipoprotein N-acyltransferase
MRPGVMVLALLTSLLLFAASPGEWAVPFLAFVALVPLFLACRGLSPRAGFRLGLGSGLVYYLGLIYWIIIALGRYGGLPLWLTIPALVGLALYMALYLALFTALCRWTTNRLPLVWAAPLIWVGLDHLRGLLFTGFPWLDLGYSQHHNLLINQVADLTGHHGLTFLIVMVNALIAEALANHHLAHAIAEPTADANLPGRRARLLSHRLLPLLLLAAAVSYSLWSTQVWEQRLASAPTVAIGLIQGNIDQSEKWLPALQEQTVERYLSLSAQAAKAEPLDLLLWPETALPFFPEAHPLFQRLTDWVATFNGQALLTGAPHFETNAATGEISYFNSAMLLAPTREGQGVALQRYAKEHLVPFGEYVPLQRFLPKALPLVQTMGNFSPGQDAGPLVNIRARMGILLCFESIFPELARIRTLRGANLLVNLTNDAWYGRSSAPYQQVPMVVLRAIENRRSLARPANTGISCLIDPLGRVLSASPIFETLFVCGRLPLIEEQSIYSRWGFLFPHLCLLLLSLILLYGNLRRDRV